MSTQGPEYTDRLLRKQYAWWKRLIDVQAPYRWNLRRLKPGFTLEIGCGVGRNLRHLRGNCVGLDHNVHSVEAARRLGLVAFTPEEFQDCGYNCPHRFDSLLLAHVAEHMTLPDAVALIQT